MFYERRAVEPQVAARASLPDVSGLVGVPLDWRSTADRHTKGIVVLKVEGVYSFGRYNILVIIPPLNIKREDLQFGIDALDRALKVLA